MADNQNVLLRDNISLSRFNLLLILINIGLVVTMFLNLKEKYVVVIDEEHNSYQGRIIKHNSKSSKIATMKAHLILAYNVAHNLDEFNYGEHMLLTLNYFGETGNNIIDDYESEKLEAIMKNRGIRISCERPRFELIELSDSYATFEGTSVHTIFRGRNVMKKELHTTVFEVYDGYSPVEDDTSEDYNPLGMKAELISRQVEPYTEEQ